MTQSVSRTLSILLLASSAVLAQEQATTSGPQDGPTTPSSDTWHLSLNPYASHAFDADFRDGTSVAVSRIGLSANSKVPLSSNVQLNLGLNPEYSHYAFSGPGDDLKLDFVDVQIAPGVEYKLSEAWSVFGGAILEGAGEDGADFGDSLTYGGYVGAKHKISDKFSYTFGVAVKTQLEDDLSFYPLIGLDWQITDYLSLTTSAASSGGQIRLTQALCKTFAVSAVAGYEFREFRLDEQTRASGVLQDTRIPVGAELAWKPSDSFSLRGTVGYVVWQEIEFDDSDGHQLTQKHPDATPYVGIAANWQF